MGLERTSVNSATTRSALDHDLDAVKDAPDGLAAHGVRGEAVLLGPTQKGGDISEVGGFVGHHFGGLGGGWNEH